MWAELSLISICDVLQKNHDATENENGSNNENDNDSWIKDNNMILRCECNAEILI